MNRIFLALAFALVFASMAAAQVQPTQILAFTFDANESSQCVKVAPGVRYFQIVWNTIGTVSAGTVKLEKSAAGPGGSCGSFSDVIAATTATASGKTNTVEDSPNFVRMTFASYSGSGTVEATMLAWIVDPSPLVMYNSSPPTLTNGQKSDLQIDANANLKVNVTDGSGALNVICDSGCGSGTQYTIGSVASATASTTMIGLVRDDSLGTLADDEGDVVTGRVTSTGAIWVQSATIDAAESAAVATNPVPVGGVYRSTLTTLADGDVGYIALDSSTRTIVVGTGTAGTPAGGVLTVQGVTSGTPLIVGDGTGALNVICDSGCGSGTQYDEDTASAPADKITMMGAVRQDTLAGLVDADGDRSGLAVNAVGRLYTTTTIDAALPTGSNNIGTVTITDGAGAVNVICDSGCAGGTQYNIGTAASATATTTMAGLIRADTLSTLADENGDVVGGRVTSTGALWVQSAVADAAESAAVATNPVPIGGVYRSTLTTLADGDVGYMALDSSTRAIVVGGGTAGTAAGGVLTVQGVASMTPLQVGDNNASLTVDAPLATPVFSTLTPSATGGWSIFNATSGDGSTACTNGAQSVKGAQGTFGGYYVYNPNAAAAYLVLYNNASPTVGTTTPAAVFTIPATGGANIEISNGLQMGTAITIACTSTAAGNGAPTSALEVNVWYK